LLGLFLLLLWLWRRRHQRKIKKKHADKEAPNEEEEAQQSAAEAAREEAERVAAQQAEERQRVELADQKRAELEAEERWRAMQLRELQLRELQLREQLVRTEQRQRELHPKAAEKEAAAERAAAEPPAEKKKATKRVLANWLKMYAHLWSSYEYAIRRPASLEELGKFRDKSIGILRVSWSAPPPLICRCPSALIRHVRRHQRIALIWRGLANAALNAEVGELSWQPDEPLLDRMLSTPLRMFARAPANPSAALTCREHKMLTRVRLAALSPRPERAFWSILELVEELRSSAPGLSRTPPSCQPSGAFPQQQSQSPLSFDSRRMVVPPSDRSYHRPYGSPPVYNLGAGSAASPTTPAALEPSAEAASAAEAEEERPLARNLDPALAEAMAEAIAKALSDQQAQQALAEAAQQQLEEKNRALMAEKDEVLMKLAEIQKKMAEKQKVSGRCGSSSPDSSLGVAQSDLTSTMLQTQRLPPHEGRVRAASSSSGLGTTANTTTVGTSAGRSDLFSADGASTPQAASSASAHYGAHYGAQAGCDSTSPPPRLSAHYGAQAGCDSTSPPPRLSAHYGAQAGCDSTSPPPRQSAHYGAQAGCDSTSPPPRLSAHYGAQAGCDSTSPPPRLSAHYGAQAGCDSTSPPPRLSARNSARNFKRPGATVLKGGREVNTARGLVSSRSETGKWVEMSQGVWTSEVAKPASVSTGVAALTARGANDKKEATAAAGESAVPPALSLNKLSELKGRDPDAPMATPRKDAPDTSRRKKAEMPDEPSSTAALAPTAAAGAAAAPKPDGTIVQDLDSQQAAVETNPAAPSGLKIEMPKVDIAATGDAAEPERPALRDNESDLYNGALVA
jgi:hypothetical protein